MTVPSATSRTNEAAERLRDNLHAIGGSGDDVFALLDAALSEERRRIVERIVAAAHKDRCEPPCLSFVNGRAALDLILDEIEVAR